MRLAVIGLAALAAAAPPGPAPPALKSDTPQALKSRPPRALEGRTPAALRNPVDAACVSSPFGWRHAVGPHAPSGVHNGVDLPAPAGAVVRAAAPGAVLWIRRRGIGGLQIMLRHAGGMATLYAHLGSVAPALAEGLRSVAAGTRLGRIGRSGITYGTHLYFEVLADGTAIDPAPLLGLPPCPSTPSARPVE